MSIYQNCTKIDISAYNTFFTNYSFYYPYAGTLSKKQFDIMVVTTLTSTFAELPLDKE